MIRACEVSEPFNVYYLDGSLEAFEATATALDSMAARLGYAYPENVMVLVVPSVPWPGPRTVIECVAGDYVVDRGGFCQKFTAEEFAARFQTIEN